MKKNFLSITISIIFLFTIINAHIPIPNDIDQPEVSDLPTKTIPKRPFLKAYSPEHVAKEIEKKHSYPLHHIAKKVTPKSNLLSFKLNNKLISVDIKKVITLLIKSYNFDINELNDDNLTTLDFATIIDNPELVSYLKNIGAEQTYHIRSCKTFEQVLEHLQQHKDELLKKQICIDLTNNKITTVPQETIEKLIPYNIVMLNLSINRITTTTLVALSKLKTLRELWLSYNNIGQQPKALEALTQFSNLEVLDLSKNNIVKPLPRALADLPRLLVLFLIDNRKIKHLDPTVKLLRERGTRVWL